MILRIDKPAGVATHSTGAESASAVQTEGCVEYFSRLLERKLFVVHRLDKETSGILLFAESPQEAAALSLQFEAREVKKTYLFITDHPSASDTFEAESFIEKKKSLFISLPLASGQNSDPDAVLSQNNLRPGYSKTRFEKIKSEGSFSLWRAFPQTGRPHQIRLHAQDCKIPILGDLQHGGSFFPNLMLLSESIEFKNHEGANENFRALPSRLMDNLSFCSSLRLSQWVLAVERRERWLRSLKYLNLPQSETHRLIHTDGGLLRCEQLGSVISLQWFGKENEGPSDIQDLIQIMNWSQWKIQPRPDRGKSPHSVPEVLSQPPPPARWEAQEYLNRFEFRRDSSLSTGLFLDQRANRGWVQKNSSGRNVLNLFCYTGGFSVSAARGSAQKVTSVDLSKNFLEWTKQNFRLNQLDESVHEFRAIDSRDFLKYADKKRLEFELIICDPPSFSRSRTGVFQIEKHFEPLLIALSRVLKKKGHLLFCTNYEHWTQQKFTDLADELCRFHKLPLELRPLPPAEWDFELPKQESLMKSLLFERIF
jgi:23S rRNA (cytosine1962-C5)-methyltransferase